VTKGRLILASGSPQRKHLLEQAGYEFDVFVPEDSEPNPALFRDTREYVSHTAWRKARQVADRVASGIIVAADTVVALEGQIIGKPADRSDARRILQQLSGSLHQCLTGICIWMPPNARWVGGVDVTDLKMRRLSPAELEAYLESDRWVGKAGAYAIQDPDPYVTIISGSHSNVVGLPLEMLDQLINCLHT
jgi:nucleoside triphosphate pyrophosphatase